MSPARDQDYFCEGMAEELIHALARLPGLRVASRTAAFQFKGHTGDMRAVGERQFVHLEAAVGARHGKQHALRVPEHLHIADEATLRWLEHGGCRGIRGQRQAHQRVVPTATG